MKRFLQVGFFLFGILGFLSFARPAEAMTFRSGNDITVPQSEKIDGTLVVSGSNLVIDANVDGDVVCMGQSIKITGMVTGDILCAGQNITITSDIGGSVRTASQILTLDGGVERNVTSVGQTITLTPNSLVQGELSLLGSDLHVDGQVVGGMHGGGKTITINGAVNKGVYVNAGDLMIGSGARVVGDVEYTSKNDAQIASGVVTGTVRKHMVTTSQKVKKQDDSARVGTAAWGMRIARAMIIAGILGVLAVALCTPFLLKVLKDIPENTLRNIGWGFLAMIVIPLGIVFLFLTIIGIPFALVGILGFLLFAMLGRVVAALYLGTRLLKTNVEKQSLYLPLAVGIIVLWIAFYIPILGGLISMISWWLGMGAILRVFMNKQWKTK